jgi:hypothetical protein
MAQFEYEVVVSDGGFRILSESSSVVRLQRSGPEQNQASVSLLRGLY